ncbi:MAG: hypothetical protein FWG02_03065 [Holophagaceae bacterium]|nr:hypothetical protein [Holophagaceae bacterium]
MQAVSSTIVLRIIIISLLMGQCAFAQKDPGQWVNGLYSVFGRAGDSLFSRPTVLIDEKNIIQSEIPSLSKAVNFPVPASFRTICLKPLWHNGILYVLARGGATEEKEDGTEFMRFTFARYQDDTWEFLGFLETPPGEMIRVIPCDNDRFILVSNKTDLIDNKRLDRSPFCLATLAKPPVKSSFPTNIPAGVPFNPVMNREDRSIVGAVVSRNATDSQRALVSTHNATNIIKLDSSIYHGMDDIKDKMSDEAWFGLAGSSLTTMTDNHVTLINYQTGLYWIFSLEKANLVWAGNIFQKVTPEFLASKNFLKGSIAVPILCFNPEIDGTILIASEDENFFLTDGSDTNKEATEIFQAMPEPKTRQDYIRIFERLEKERHERNPFVVWYRLFPESGRVEKLPDAPNGGSLLKSEFLTTTFRPMPDGSVKMGNIILEEAKKVAIDGDSNAVNK